MYPKEEMSEIKADNQIIAEFMGAIINEDMTCSNYSKIGIPAFPAFELFDFDTLKVNGYPYHKSWDWLMPVVQKISEMQLNEYVTTLPIFTPIETVYKAVVKFIKWYNQSQNP